MNSGMPAASAMTGHEQAAHSRPPPSTVSFRCTAVVRGLRGYTRYGSTAVSRFADQPARYPSVALDRQTADTRENPESASCCHRIEREISISMTGIKVQPS